MIACSAAVTTPNPTFEEGWILYQKPADRFVIALPSNWKEIPLDQKKLAAAYEVIMKNNPSMAAYMKDPMGRQMLAFLKFAALDSERDAIISGFPTSVEIHRIPGKIDQTLDNLVQEYLITLRAKAYVVNPVSDRSVDLPVGSAHELRFGLNMTRPNGESVTVAVTQYFVDGGDHLYIIKFLTRSRDAQKHAPTFAKSIQSFRFAGN